MTDERFVEFATQSTDNGEINNGFYDIKTGKWYYTKDSENAKKICELLNELHEENQLVKDTLNELKSIDGFWDSALLQGYISKIAKILGVDLE